MVTYYRNFYFYLSSMVLTVVNLNYSVHFTDIYYTYTQLIKTVMSSYAYLWNTANTIAVNPQLCQVY